MSNTFPPFTVISFGKLQECRCTIFGKGSLYYVSIPNYLQVSSIIAVLSIPEFIFSGAGRTEKPFPLGIEPETKFIFFSAKIKWNNQKNEMSLSKIIKSDIF